MIESLNYFYSTQYSHLWFYINGEDYADISIWRLKEFNSTFMKVNNCLLIMCVLLCFSLGE